MKVSRDDIVLVCIPFVAVQNLAFNENAENSWPPVRAQIG